MSTVNRQNYKLIAILTAALAAGLPLWTSSARRVDFLDFYFLSLWVIFGALAAFFVLFFIRLKTRDMISSFIVGYMIAVIIYFVGLIFAANVIHNQFLTSLLIAIATGAITGWIGSLSWRWIKRKNRT